MKRRDVLKSISTIGFATLGSRFGFTQSLPPSLKQIGQSKGLLFGSSLALKYFVQSPSYKQLFISECDIATPEIHMKWSSLSNARGVYNFNNADQFVAFCAGNNIKVRGHTLVWHDSLPAWIGQQINPGNGRAIMLEHIQKVAGHYAGQLYSWDVVNEVLDPGSGRPDGLRKTPWLTNIGPGYIETAFRAAAQADPKAMLIWNENHIENADSVGIAKRKAMLSLLDDLLKRGVPIQGIGIESHLRGDQLDLIGDQSYETFLSELARRKMKIFITELDVQDVAFPSDVAARDKAVATVYSKFLTATLRQPAVKAVVTWGLLDAYSWIGGFAPRSDGSAVRPLPFDANGQPKPAFQALLNAFHGAPTRT